MPRLKVRMLKNRWGGPGVLPEEEDFFLTPGSRGGEFFYSLWQSRPATLASEEEALALALAPLRGSLLTYLRGMEN